MSSHLHLFAFKRVTSYAWRLQLPRVWGRICVAIIATQAHYNDACGTLHLQSSIWPSHSDL